MSAKKPTKKNQQKRKAIHPASTDSINPETNPLNPIDTNQSNNKVNAECND